MEAIKNAIKNISYLLQGDTTVSPIPQEKPKLLERLGYTMANGPAMEGAGIQSQAYKKKMEEEGKKKLESYERVRRIMKGMQGFFKNYGSPFSQEDIGSFAAEAEKYPITQKYPYLMPAISVNETSAGKNVSHPNNPLNWGIYEPTFQPKSNLETIAKATSGIAQRFPQYQKFRDTGNLMDFGNTYAPPSDNNDPNYGGKLAELFKQFQQYE